MTNLDESQLTIGQIAYQILTGEGVTDVAWAQFLKLFFENCKDEDGENRYFYAFELKDSVYDIIDKIRAHETAILDEAKTAIDKTLEEIKEPEPTYSVGDYFKMTNGYGGIYVYKLCSASFCMNRVILQKVHDDYSYWLNVGSNPETRITNAFSITETDFERITGKHQNLFTKITKAEAESIVGYALD
jgi:hypothetical protein